MGAGGGGARDAGRGELQAPPSALLSAGLSRLSSHPLTDTLSFASPPPRQLARGPIFGSSNPPLLFRSHPSRRCRLPCARHHPFRTGGRQFRFTEHWKQGSGHPVRCSDCMFIFPLAQRLLISCFVSELPLYQSLRRAANSLTSLRPSCCPPPSHPGMSPCSRGACKCPSFFLRGAARVLRQCPPQERAPSHPPPALQGHRQNHGSHPGTRPPSRVPDPPSLSCCEPAFSPGPA